MTHNVYIHRRRAGSSSPIAAIRLHAHTLYLGVLREDSTNLIANLIGATAPKTGLYQPYVNVDNI